MGSNTTPLTELEQRILKMIPDTRWVDAYTIEKGLEGSGVTVADAVNALGALVDRGLLDHGVHKGPTHDTAFWRRLD